MSDEREQVAELLVWLSRLARVHEAILARCNADHDLLPSETGVLVVLWRSGPPHRLRPSALASALLQTSGGMTATLRRLEAAGLIERVPDPADGRVSLAALTPRGAAVGLASLDGMVDWYVDALAGVPTERRSELAAALRTLLDALEASSGLGDSSVALEPGGR